MRQYWLAFNNGFMYSFCGDNVTIDDDWCCVMDGNRVVAKFRSDFIDGVFDDYGVDVESFRFRRGEEK